jgi:hypothetical protein
MGKFWPQTICETTPSSTSTVVNYTGGTYAGGVWEKKKPVVVIDSVKEKNIKISVVITGVEDND